MKKDQLKKIYKDKINEFKKNNLLYFEKNSPSISDAEFDDLKREILNLEKDYPFLKSKDSPSQVLGHKPSKIFKKAFHKVPMLSLANAFSEDDLINFEKKIKNFLDQKDNKEIEYSVEPKIDGISASLTYKNGNFERGLSRGDGREGEDITANLSTIKDIPKLIDSEDFPEEIDIRGEVFIQNSDFDNLKDKFGSHGIVGLVILYIINDATLFIDTFCMSCRVFNRGFEYFIIDHIKSIMAKKDYKNLVVEWIPTEKNSLVNDFYLSLGFKNFKNKKNTLDVDNIKIHKHFIN